MIGNRDHAVGLVAVFHHNDSFRTNSRTERFELCATAPPLTSTCFKCAVEKVAYLFQRGHLKFYLFAVDVPSFGPCWGLVG